MFRRAARIACLLVLVAIGCTAKPPSVLSGRDEAERDVSRGIVKLYLYAESTPAHTKFAELLAEDCHGTVEQLGAATLSDERDQRIQDYNRYMLQELFRRHGAKAVATLCERSGLTLEHIIRKHPKGCRDAIGRLEQQHEPPRPDPRIARNQFFKNRSPRCRRTRGPAARTRRFD
jgi:hypothetical protein